MQRPNLSLATALKLPSALPAELVGQRPDVVASRWQVAAQARGIDVAHAGFFPNVDRVGSLGFMATGGGPLEFLTGRKFNYNVGPAISLPVFDGGRLRSQLGVASAGYDIAVARYNQTLVNALKNISDQLIRRESMDKQQTFAAESVASAQKTYDRNLGLSQQNLLATSELESAAGGLASAQAALAALEAQIDQAEISVETAQLDLSRTTITAPELFERYLVENFQVILANHGGAIEVGESNTRIPLHFAIPPGQRIDGEAINALPRLKLRGLMAIPEPTEDRAAQDAAFAAVQSLQASLNLPLDTLSMGMSHDLESAIAQGATWVRIGTALFGARDYGQP